jgi:hypothetical protein
MQINLEGSLMSGLGTLIIAIISAMWKQNSNDRKERREQVSEDRKERKDRDKALYDKIGELSKSMSNVRENFVSHNVCRINRQDCPCHKEIKEIKEGLKK